MHNETDDQLEIGRRIQKRLEALCAKKGISRRKLAGKMGIREDYLGKMVRGKRPWNLNYLKQVADGLDVTLDALLGDAYQLPVVAEIGGGKEDFFPYFDYKAVLLPKKDGTYVPYPELPKSLAAKTYILEITGPELLPDLLPGSHLYVVRGLGDTDKLKNDDLAVYVDDETDRGYICRIKRDDLHIHFHSLYAIPDPRSGSTLKPIFHKIAATASGIDMVVAIVLCPDLLISG